MISPTEFVFKNTAFFIVAMVILITLGFWTYAHFPSQEDPSFTIREAVITTVYPGMSAEKVEDLITRVLEEKIREIPEIEFIKASSKTDISLIHVTLYDKYFDLKPIWTDLRNKVADATQELPSGIKGPFINDDYGDVSIASVAITADGFSPAQMYDAALDVRKDLYKIKGVKRIDLYGEQHENIYLYFSNAKLAEFGISPQVVIQALREANTLLPGGKMEVLGRELVIEPSGNFLSVEEIKQMQIKSPSTGHSIYLRDLLEVKREYQDPPQYLAFYNGKPAIILSVSMNEGQNVLELGNKIKMEVSKIEHSLPIGYELHFATFQPDWVSASMNEFTGNLYQTLFIVLAIVIVFLGWRTGLIVGLNVPLTILVTLVIMYWMQIPLHRVSIAALIISLGLLVDNGIVIAEDIKMRLQKGEPRDRACIDAGNSLFIPLLSSSLTTILAFLPLMLAPHRAGEYVYAISQVVAITLLVSWFLAVTAVPLACYYGIRLDSKQTFQTEEALYQKGFYLHYQNALAWILLHKKAFLSGMFILFCLSIVMMRGVPNQFFPPSDRAQYTIYLDLARGASIKETEQVVNKFNHWLLDKEKNPEIKSTVAYVGQGGPRFFLSLSPFDPDPHRAFILVDLNEIDDLQNSMRKSKHFALSQLPQANADIKTLFLGPSETGAVQMRISGKDPQTVYDIGEKVKVLLHQIPGTEAIESDWGNKTASIFIDIDESKANRNQISASDVALSLSAFYSGYQMTEYREGDKLLPIVLRAQDNERTILDRLRTVNVYSQSTGKSIPLLQIAEFVPGWKFGQMKRRNFEPTLTLTARNPELYAAELQKKILPLLQEVNFPAGYHLEWGGELEDSETAQKALFAYLPLCLVLGFLLLVWQFKSIIRASIVFLTLPLLMIGGVLGLVVMHAAFGFVAMLGFMSLGGILVNNAIVLIDQADEGLRAGLTAEIAMKEACLRRFRPILMTTLTTVLGLLPLIFWGGDMWYGMANVIAWGLSVATVLTLGMVPLLYVSFLENKILSPHN